MWRIFHYASRVDDSFGPAGNDISALGTALKPTSTPTIRNLNRLGLSVAVGFALEFLLSCAYFTRTWIVPEIMQARTIITRCGDEVSIAWLNCTGGAFESLYPHVKTVCMIRRTTTRAPDVPFDLFLSYAMTQCSDPRGKVSATFGDPRLRALGERAQLTVDCIVSREELSPAVMRQHLSYATGMEAS